MAREQVRVTDSVKDGVVVFEIAYRPELLVSAGFANQLKTVLVRRYEELTGSKKALPLPCVVVIESSSAGTPMTNALQELSNVVSKGRGAKLVCVGFPQAEEEILRRYGLSNQPLFRKAGDLPEALKEAKG
jgi:hypothetical protein